MKLTGVLITCILFFSGSGLAQDLIMRRDSSQSFGKITEIRNDYVRYTYSAGTKTVSASTKDLAYIRLENGYTQKFELPPPAPILTEFDFIPRYSQSDSLRYFSHPQSIGINYLCFANREFGIIYQREYIKKQISVVIPFTIGLDKPMITHRFYFKNNFSYLVGQKLFDAGIGINYFPNYKKKTNFYLGPMLRTQFYRGEQVLLPYTNSPLVVKQSFLSRMSLSLTSGYIIRSKSRLQVHLFTSLGACADFVPFKIRRPLDNKAINPIGDPLSFYIWTGFLVGYCF